MVAADLTGAISVIEIDDGEEVVSFDGATTHNDPRCVPGRFDGGRPDLRWRHRDLVVGNGSLRASTSHTGEVTGLALAPADVTARRGR